MYSLLLSDYTIQIGIQQIYLSQTYNTTRDQLPRDPVQPRLQILAPSPLRAPGRGGSAAAASAANGVDATEHDKLVAVLDEALEAPFEGLAAALVGAGGAEEDAGAASAVVAVALDVERVREHARDGVLERVEGDLGRVALCGDERGRGRVGGADRDGGAGRVRGGVGRGRLVATRSGHRDGRHLGVGESGRDATGGERRGDVMAEDPGPWPGGVGREEECFIAERRGGGRGM